MTNQETSLEETSLEETCDQWGRHADENPQHFIQRLASALDETTIERDQAKTLLANLKETNDRDLGPIRTITGALDADQQAVEIVAYVSGQVTLASQAGALLVDRNSWNRLRHRVDMLLGIPAPSLQQEPVLRISNTKAAAELRARLTDVALTAFKTSPKGDGTTNAYSEASIRALCFAIAQELTTAPVPATTPPTAP